jgi:hypothetical protein
VHWVGLTRKVARRNPGEGVYSFVDIGLIWIGGWFGDM